MISFRHRTKPLCYNREDGCLFPLCLVLGKHLLLHAELLRRKLEDNFIIAAIAKTLENVLSLSGPPIQREFQVGYRQGTSSLFGQNMACVVIDVTSFECVRDQ